MQFLTGKYRNIIFAIGLFILLDASILGINYYLSFAIARDALAVSQAGELQMMSQRIMKSLYALQFAMQSDDDEKKPFAELKDTYQRFDDTIEAFKKGGITEKPDGSQLVMEAVRDPEGAALVHRIDAVWQPFRNIVNPVVNMPEPVREEWFQDNLQQASGYVASNNITLLQSASGLATHLEGVAAAKASELRLIQTIGITLAIINFIIIIYHFIGQLRYTDRRIEEAQQQTRKILDFVGEGLFLLDRNLVLSSQHSAYAEKLFASNAIAGMNFLDLLRHKISEEELRTVKRYLSLLVDGNVKEEQADDLNPLRQIRLAISESGGKFVQKYLSFHFSRTWRDNEVAEILVTARDITAQVKLQDELKQLQNTQGDQLSILVKILELDPWEYSGFITESLRRLNRINATLKQKSRKTEQFRVQIDSILIELHKLKGESSMMNMHKIANEVHLMEEIVLGIRQQEVIEGDHFLPVAVKLKNLLKELEQYEQIASMLSRNTRRFSQEEAESQIVSRKSVENLVDGIARKHDKKVELILQQRGIKLIPDTMQRPVRDIVVQLIRNSVTHGIEPQPDRQAAGKSCKGQVKIVIIADHKELVLSVHDDGRGINLDAIRNKLVRLGTHSAEQVAQMSENQLVRMIFEPGFSTASSVDEDAGRGVGMSVIKHMIERMNGKIGVISEAGKYCRFTIRFPFEMGSTTGKYQAIASKQDDAGAGFAKAS